MARFYPVYLNIADHLCVVVGGGGVAERKVGGLLEAGAPVRVISPEATATLRQLSERGEIEHRAVFYEPEHLNGARLVFAATNVRAVNARVARDSRARDIFVNVADLPDEGSFVLPAVVRRGEFCLSISTGGNNPTLAARLAAEMHEQFSAEYGVFVELLGDVRDTIKEWTSDRAARRDAAAAVLDHEADVRAHLAAGHVDKARELALSVARTAAGIAEPSPARPVAKTDPSDG